VTAGRWISAGVIGVVTSVAVLSGAWSYLLLAIPGTLLVLLALAFPRAALLLWVLLAPIATAYGTLELPGGIPDITFSRLVVGLVAIALLLRSRIQGRRFGPVEGPELAMLAMLVVLALDFMARAENRPSEALQHFDERVVPCLLFVFARSLFVHPADRRRVAWAIAISASIVAAHATYQVIRGGPTVSITGELTSAVTREGGARVNESHFEQGRGVGPFTNGVESGGVVAIGLGAALYLAFHGASGWLRLAPALMTIPLVTGVVASLTRSVWISAYLALVATLFLDRQARRTLGAGLVVVSVVLVAFFFGSEQAAPLRSRAESVEPVTGRLIMYRLAGELTLERPFTGYGSGLPTRLAVLSKLRGEGGVDADLAPGQFHNTFLMVLVEWGIGGLLTWVLVLGSLLWGAIALRARGPDDDADAYYFGGVLIFASVVYLIQCVLVDIPGFLYLSDLYFFLAGVVYGQLDGPALHEAADRLPLPATARA
jgi:O-antigen ligase